VLPPVTKFYATFISQTKFYATFISQTSQPPLLPEYPPSTLPLRSKSTGVQIYTNNEENACRFVIRSGDPASVHQAKSIIKRAVDRERQLRLLNPNLVYVILNRDVDPGELRDSPDYSHSLRPQETIHFIPYPLAASYSPPTNGVGPLVPAESPSVQYKAICSKPTPVPTTYYYHNAGGGPHHFASDGIPSDPANHTFCETTAAPSCLESVAREIRDAAAVPDQQLSLEIRLGHQLFADVPVAYVEAESGYGGMTVPEWCEQVVGKPIRSWFRVGLPMGDMSLLADWLFLEGFENSKIEDVIVVHYTSNLHDRRTTAYLKWDDIRGRWQLIKLRDRYRRIAILSFVEPYLNSVDHRLSLSSRDPAVERGGASGDRLIRDYVQTRQAQLARVDDRRRMRFVDSSEILFECVEYQRKRQYRNELFKVTITSVDQDTASSGRLTHQSEVTISHLAWKRLKDLAKPCAAAANQDPEHVSAVVQNAAQAMQESVAFAGKMSRVMAIYQK
ncbi:hypothetical protein BC936DRAFT_143170, partial [Jimgerdemannia flammicorona]